MAHIEKTAGGAWLANGLDENATVHYALGETLLLLVKQGYFPIEDPRRDPDSEDAIPPYIPLGAGEGGGGQ